MSTQGTGAGALFPDESIKVDAEQNTAQRFAALQFERQCLPGTTFAATTPLTPTLRTGRYSKFCLRMTCIGDIDMQSAADNAKLVVAEKADAVFAKKTRRDINTMLLPTSKAVDFQPQKKVRARSPVSMLSMAASTSAEGLHKDPTVTKKLQARSPVSMLPMAASTSAKGLDKDPTGTKKVRARSPVSMLLMAASMFAEGLHKDPTVTKKSRAYLCSKCDAEKKGHQCPFAPENMTKSAFRLVHPKRSHKSLVTLRKAAARVTV